MDATLSLAAFAALAFASFATAAFSAAVGIGGGPALFAVMPHFMPISAAIPVHGANQLAATLTRFAFSWREASLRLLPAYVAGALAGGGLGYLFLGQVPERALTLLVGSFILIVQWTPLLARTGRALSNFFTVGAAQTFISLFVAGAGALSQPLLMRAGLNKEGVIVTSAMQTTVLHAVKVAAFVFAGFSFAAWWQLTLLMIAGSAAGSWCGARWRNAIPEVLGMRILKYGISLLALKMLVDGIFWH